METRETQEGLRSTFKVTRSVLTEPGSDGWAPEEKAVTLQQRRLQTGILDVDSLRHTQAFQGPRKQHNHANVTPL